MATHGRSGPQWNLRNTVPPTLAGDTLAKGKRGPLISDARFAPPNVTDGLGLLKELVGTWRGNGFNLIARPAFHYKQDLYLQLNRTSETLTFQAIGSPIPNRGFAQEDITLYGLTYLQQISDATVAGTAGALHIEPGIWVVLPRDITAPADPPPPHGDLVARMGTIPHGNAILACGTAEPFTGPPTLQPPNATPHGSKFYAFNSTPIGAVPTVPNTVPPVFSATGSSAKGTHLANPTIVPLFNEYDLTVPAGHTNPRTPLDSPFPDPQTIGITQAIVNDPIVVLQQVIEKQIQEGYSFEGVALNIATTTNPTTALPTQTIDFSINPNSVIGGPVVPTSLPSFRGAAENILFLFDDLPPPPPRGNAETDVIYATFWITKVTHKRHGHSFMQLQYAQMVTLNFPIAHLLPQTFVNLGWPHITVGTLVKHFG